MDVGHAGVDEESKNRCTDRGRIDEWRNMDEQINESMEE